MQAPKEFSSVLKHLASEIQGNTTRSSLLFIPRLPAPIPGCHWIGVV